ncbi:MAG: hypothetical protein IKU48_00725 [Clostridia bacterium]|nr:hypothetical protein [Clostridia bacterium]
MKTYSYNVDLLNEEQKKEFVLKCENEFEAQLERSSDFIAEHRTRIITLSGPTCSGKTTTASRFISALEKNGGKVGVISIDDFYKSRKQLEKESKERGLSEVDYDSALSIDLDCFEACIDGILENKQVSLPRYSFEKGRRDSVYEFDSSRYNYIILEGIQAVYPEVTEHIHCGFKSVQISVVPDVEVNGVFFTNRQIRFMRRMIRDAKFRNAPPEVTFEMWKGVSRNEDLHILPFAGQFDIELDSFMEYEPFMIRNNVLGLLKDIKPEYEFFSKAKEIREKMQEFFDISPEYLPERSVYHEFLG